MSELPSGTVTFLFSDIEGSTRLMQRLDDRWGEALATHNRLLREAFAEAGGREVDRQGDAFFAVFPRARDAVTAAVAAQRALEAHTWPGDIELRVRMGLHTGEPSVGDEGYLGLDVVRASRICALARGGQVLVSETTRALVRGERDFELVDAGEHALKDLDEPERLFRVRAERLPDIDATLPDAPGRELVRFAGDADDLAERARDAMQAAGTRMRELDSLGPRIEAGVEEMLRTMGVPAPGVPPSVPTPSPVPAARRAARSRREPSTATLVWLIIGGIVVVVPVVALLLDRL